MVEGRVEVYYSCCLIMCKTMQKVQVIHESNPPSHPPLPPSLLPSLPPSSRHVLGYANASNPFLFQRTLESRATDVISKYSEGKSTLVFCGSKKGAETLAAKLAGTASVLTGGNGGGRGQGQGGGRQQQQEQAERFLGLQNHKLKELMLSCGGAAAFHHAGLSAEDRACVEALFQQGVVRVLCSTSTLAQGINSPAFLAIVLGTTFWRGAGTGYEDLPVSAVLQMIGRAGRPGYDDRGVAVIMTSKDKELAYTSMAEGQEVVESQLPARFHEALNAEVCSHVISNLLDAMRWLRSTFLWVRAHRNPRHYAALLPRDTSSPDADNSVGGRLKAYMLRTLAELEAEEALRLGEPAVDVDAMPDSAAQESKTVVPMVAGRVMSKTVRYTPLPSPPPPYSFLPSHADFPPFLSLSQSPPPPPTDGQLRDDQDPARAAFRR